MSNSISPCDPLIKLVVGHEATTMTVHRGVIVKSSGFFKAAFQPEWASQRDNPDTFSMPEDSPEDVKLYISWCYTGTVDIPLCIHDPSVDDVIRAPEAAKTYVALAHAYVFSERVFDNAYSNAVIKHIITALAASRWTPGHEFADVLYAGTLPGCTARRLFADMVGRCVWIDGKRIGWHSVVERFDKEMLLDVVKSVMRSRDSRLKPKPIRWEVELESYLKDEGVEDLSDLVREDIQD